MKNFVNLKISTILLIINFATLISQDIPRVISYQGVIVDADGRPISGKKTLTFKLQQKNNSPFHYWIETIEDVQINGGLFFVPLGLNSDPKGFPTLNGEYDLVVSFDNQNFFVPLYSSVSALNIPDGIVSSRKLADNSVTSEKIKDGEVKADDLSDMGATEGQILVRRQNKWASENLPESVPMGTILPYMGEGFATFRDLEKQGWFLCDGRTIASLNNLTDQEKINLQNFLANSGNPDPGKLPDLRGMFLRGANRNRTDSLYIDPDFSLRPGTGYKIGSVQLDEFKRHNHTYTYPARVDHTKRSGTDPMNLSYVGGITKTSDSGGSETRPKNIYVNFIIKVK